MWIIPSNHPLYSAFAPEFLASKEDLKELSDQSISWPTWKSKPSSLPTWLRAWNRVYWIQHLFGRMLKPSMHSHFMEKYTASLEVIHAPVNRLPGFEKAIFIKDSFGLLLEKLSQQLDLFGVSSKTWTTTLQVRIQLYKEAYAIWVTQLRQEYTQRMKLVHHMNGKGCSSWPSPMAQDFGGGTRGDFSPKLSMVVKNYPTPDAQDYKHPGQSQGRRQMSRLNKVVTINWPTPTANENSYRLSGNTQQSNSLSAIMRRSVLGPGQLLQDPGHTASKNREQLNPAWVAQLMGTTLEKTFFVPMVIAWSNKPQSSPSEI